MTKSGTVVPDSCIDRAHRIGKKFTNKVDNKLSQSVIVRFTTFRHRTMFYRKRKLTSPNIKVKLDLTKSRYNLLKDAIEYVRNLDSVNFVYADINCRLKVRYNDDNERFF